MNGPRLLSWETSLYSRGEGPLGECEGRLDCRCRDVLEFDGPFFVLDETELKTINGRSGQDVVCASVLHRGAVYRICAWKSMWDELKAHR